MENIKKENISITKAELLQVLKGVGLGDMDIDSIGDDEEITGYDINFDISDDPRVAITHNKRK